MVSVIITSAIIAALVADFFFVELEFFGWTFLTLLLSGIAVCWTNLWNLQPWILNHALLCVAFVGAYIVAGVIWSFIKWYSYLIELRDSYSDIKDKFVAVKKALLERQLLWAEDYNQCNTSQVKIESLPNMSYEFQQPFFKIEGNSELYHEYKNAAVSYGRFDKPRATDNKGRIIAWIFYWPFSLVGTLVNHPVRKFINFLFAKLKASYQKLSDNIFKEFPET